MNSIELTDGECMIVRAILDYHNKKQKRGPQTTFHRAGVRITERCLAKIPVFDSDDVAVTCELMKLLKED